MTIAQFTGPPGGNVDDLGFESPWNQKRDVDEENEEIAVSKLEYTKFWADYFPVVFRRRKRWEKADPRRNPKTHWRTEADHLNLMTSSFVV
ncbi:hypothetical protein DICVIV_11240 [Dictyocaulus viviparus]|uniref:Uncharacterized protein n=1 Tax=Dictyocaulus viviparus TaxID=29172 RepID=A0A0D8XDR2_DICVI|nr:hypothetical protein DICVIV_11240 [Dictyocaulus viviparus]